MGKTIIDIASGRKQVVFGKDGIVIQKHIASLKGGRALVVTDFTDDYIYAGHVIITKDGVYKPMPVVAATETVAAHYGTLPEGWAYAGILRTTIEKARPLAPVMIDGLVNIAATEYPMEGVTYTESGEGGEQEVTVGNILAAFKAACPCVKFVKDEE